MTHDIPIEDIRPNPRQPRKHFEGIEELAESLKAQGQLTPALVRAVGDGYELVHGERRWRAAKLAGLPTLRAEVRELSDTEAFHLGLIENLQRDDLTPIEEAEAYKSLQAEGMTQASIGKLVGRTQSYVAQKLRLLRLLGDIRKAIEAGHLSEGHARQLLRLKEAESQDELCRRAVEWRWPIRSLRAAVSCQLATDTLSLPAIDSCFADMGQAYACLDARCSDAWDDLEGLAAVVAEASWWVNVVAELRLRIERAVGKLLAES